MDKADKPTPKVIYENDNYKVIIGDSLLLENAVVYKAVNKVTGVEEAEEQMLPRIIDYANQLDEKLKEIEDEGGLGEEGGEDLGLDFIPKDPSTLN